MNQKINWKIRFHNKVWLAGFISQTLLLIQAVIVGLHTMGVLNINVNDVHDWVVWITGVVDLVLAYLSYLGIIVDPTVNGLGDSQKALNREKPL
ncbi:phage holin [Peribacillus asahii]|uniref:phage holin n=1 Tax=Peribacillus asahii TaxID=228899 RepID=UPI00207A6894|nr:phage holin [Peribacillus asahii]USK72731.1 phage holin [Peribacillus asahii]